MFEWCRKSQIAIEYCYRFKETHPQSYVFWVHASSAERFEQAYDDIARRLKIPGWDDPKISKLKLVSDWLNDTNHIKWLVVLDNADDEHVFFPIRDRLTSAEADVNHCPTPLAIYLPQASKGSLLITSRNRDAAVRLTGKVKNIIDVPSMSVEDAKSLLGRKLSDDDSHDNDRTGLVKALECLPLAITQAAAYIDMRKPRMTVSKYLTYFQENEPVLLEDMGDLRRDPTVPNSVIVTWHLSFDQIKKHHPQAAELLSLMSVLDRQGIPDYLISKDKGRLEFENALAPLNNFSLIITESGGNVFGIHRLVQLAMRTWLVKHSEMKDYKEKAIRLLAETFPFGEFENLELCTALLPHTEVVLQYQALNQTSSIQRAKILYNIAWYFRTQGNYGLAQERSQQALGLCRAFLPEEDPRFINSLGLHGSILEDQGKYDQAEDKIRHALKLSKTVLGLENEQTLRHLNNLGVALLSNGKYDKAAKTYKQLLDLENKFFGPEYPGTLNSMHNLAAVLRQQGKYKESEEMSRKVLEKSKKVQGPEHPNTLTYMNNLAIVLQSQGDYKESEEMSRKVLEISKQMQGPEHPDTLSCMNNLAAVLQEQGKYKDSEEMSRKVLEINKQVQGPEHPKTLSCMNNLAANLTRQRKYVEAGELLLSLVNSCEKVLGLNHPDTLLGISNLAATLNMDRDSEAKLLEQQVRERKEAFSRGENPTQDGNATGASSGNSTTNAETALKCGASAEGSKGLKL